MTFTLSSFYFSRRVIDVHTLLFLLSSSLIIIPITNHFLIYLPIPFYIFNHIIFHLFVYIIITKLTFPSGVDLELIKL